MSIGIILLTAGLAMESPPHQDLQLTLNSNYHPDMKRKCFHTEGGRQVFIIIITFLYDNYFIVHLKQTPTKGNEFGVHPVFDLVGVGDVVDVSILHPLQ